MFIVETPIIGSLNHVNTYVIKGDDESLVVDAGPDFFFSKMMLFRSLRVVKVNLRKSVFLATHSHVDHFGLIEKFAVESKIYIGHKEVESLFRNEDLKDILTFAVENGFPEHEATMIARLMFRRRLKKPLEPVPLKDGDVIEVGGYKFRCIETPGHTRGHICLYDQERRLLISGDHILDDITPNISSWSYEEDMLSTYLSSLKRTYEIDARFVLPGHGKVFTGLKRRVIELINHYRWRLLEIINVLAYRSGSAYWISSKIKWRTRASFWERMLNVQKWLAFGETLACLNFLVKLGIVERRTSRNKVLYNMSHDNAVEELNNHFLRLYNFNRLIC